MGVAASPSRQAWQDCYPPVTATPMFDKFRHHLMKKCYNVPRQSLPPKLLSFFPHARGRSQIPLFCRAAAKDNTNTIYRTIFRAPSFAGSARDRDDGLTPSVRLEMGR